MMERFFHHYGGLEESNEDSAQPYAGAATRSHPARCGLRTAVVTNKEHRFAGALLQRLALGQGRCMSAEIPARGASRPAALALCV